MENKKIIEVRNITKEFNVGKSKISVLSNMDFDILRGEFIMIVGPSGSGKSTLLNIINGWLEPEHGDIYINGQNIYLKDEKERLALAQKHISIVHQSPSWLKSLSVIENIALPMMVRGADRSSSLRRAGEIIDLLALEEIGHHNPIDISGGQQQRIALLRSLITNPDVLIMDEPTGSLDQSSGLILMFLLSTLNKKIGKTIIMATHDLGLLKYATRVLYINKGKVEREEINEKDFKPIESVGDILDIKKGGAYIKE